MTPWKLYFLGAIEMVLPITKLIVVSSCTRELSVVAGQVVAGQGTNKVWQPVQPHQQNTAALAMESERTICGHLNQCTRCVCHQWACLRACLA